MDPTSQTDTPFLGTAGQIFLILAFGLIIALLVKYLVSKVAKFSPSYESVYTAVIVGYLCAFALGALLGALGFRQGLGSVLMVGLGFAIQVFAYAKIILGPNGERLRLSQSVIVSVLQALVGLVVVSIVYFFIIGGGG